MAAFSTKLGRSGAASVIVPYITDISAIHGGLMTLCWWGWDDAMLVGLG